MYVFWNTCICSEAKFSLKEQHFIVTSDIMSEYF